MLLPRENGLDRAITPVAHPAAQAMIERGVFGERAVAYALHPAANDDVTDRLKVHPNSPVSRARAPRHPDGDQRASERT